MDNQSPAITIEQRTIALGESHVGTEQVSMKRSVAVTARATLPAESSDPQSFPILAPSGHFPSPGAGLLTARLDEILESLQISFHSAGNHTDRVAGLFHRPLGLIFQPKVEF